MSRKLIIVEKVGESGFSPAAAVRNVFSSFIPPLKA